MSNLYVPPLKRRKSSNQDAVHKVSVSTNLAPSLMNDIFFTLFQRNTEDSNNVYKLLMSGKESLNSFLSLFRLKTNIILAKNEILVNWDVQTKFKFETNNEKVPRLHYFMRCLAMNVCSINVNYIEPIFSEMVIKAIQRNPKNAKVRTILWSCPNAPFLEYLLKTKKVMDSFLVHTDVLSKCKIPPHGIFVDTLFLECNVFADFSVVLNNLDYRIRKLHLRFREFDWNDLHNFLLLFSPSNSFPAYTGITCLHISGQISCFHPVLESFFESIVFLFPHVRRFVLHFCRLTEMGVTSQNYNTNSVIYQVKTILNIFTTLSLPYEVKIKMCRVDILINPENTEGHDIKKDFERIRHELKDVLPMGNACNEFRQKYMVGNKKKLNFGLFLETENDSSTAAMQSKLSSVNFY